MPNKKQSGKNLVGALAWVALLLAVHSLLPAENCQEYGYVTIPLDCQNFQPSALDTGDVDGDGNDDIAYACYLESAVTLLRARNSDQTDYERIAITSFGNVAPYPIQVVLGDVDMDGKTDIVVVGNTTPQGLPTQTVQMVWFRNPGNPLGGAWEMRVMRAQQSSLKGFLLDVTQDGYPDFVPESSSGGNVLVNPGASVLEDASWASAPLVTNLPGTDIFWRPAELDGNPDTVTLLGGLRPNTSTAPYRTDIFRATLTSSLHFDLVGFPRQSNWNIGYYPRLNIGDYDGDGIDEFLSGITGGSLDPVSIIKVPQGGGAQALPQVMLFTVADLDSDIFVPAFINNDAAPDIVLSRLTDASLLNVATAPGTFPSIPTCNSLLDEQISRVMTIPPPVQPLGHAPQRFLIPGLSQLNIAYPLQPGAGIQIAFASETSFGVHPGQRSQGEITLTNSGSFTLPPSTLGLTPTSDNYSLEQGTVDFPEVAPGESTTLPFYFTPDEQAACGSSITGSVVGYFGGLRTTPLQYEAGIGRDIGADRVYTDDTRVILPDGTGGLIQRFLTTSPLTPAIDGYLVSVNINSTAGNRLLVRFEDEAGVSTIVFDGDVESTGLLHLEKEVLSPVGLSDGGAFTLFVSDARPLSPAALESWSVTIKRPRIECISPNQARVVDLLLGERTSDSVLDSNIDSTFDAADLPIVFPD